MVEQEHLWYKSRERIKILGFFTWNKTSGGEFEIKEEWQIECQKENKIDDEIKGHFVPAVNFNFVKCEVQEEHIDWRKYRRRSFRIGNEI